jgi:lysophospholipase L1-like esterase
LASFCNQKRAMFRFLLSALGLLALASAATAQTLSAGDFRIDWQVSNRFRLFTNPADFKLHENAWRQYRLHVGQQGLGEAETERLIADTSVLGSEHVLNDRHIAFTNILRDNFDWRGWAAKGLGQTCYDKDRRQYTACGSLDAYLTPASHAIEMWLTPIGTVPLPRDRICQWSIAGQVVARQGCAERIAGPGVALPYPGGADISVSVLGEQPITAGATVRDILIAGLGDSFASGEGNPDRPVEFDPLRRYHNYYPLRKANSAAGNAQWTDTLCHRSLYGQLTRAALQIAVENPQASVTYLDYSCSGAAIDDGILGPQTYVERVSDGDVTGRAARPLQGGNRDGELYRLLRDLCAAKPSYSRGLWRCPDEKFRRPLDFLFLSVGGNDLGFSNVVAWATLRDGTSAELARFFGATVSAREFEKRMTKDLPAAYGRLAKALEAALPLYSGGEKVFDPSRVVLAAYPNLVSDENGRLCPASDGSSNHPDDFVANQSLDMFGSWLEAQHSRLAAVSDLFNTLSGRMKDLAADHGWTFADRAISERLFARHGFCARNAQLAGEPAETLMMPCWGTADRPTQTCQTDLSSKPKDWRPYNPAAQNYPYALRQRWVRTFNDAYLVINQKVSDRSGRIDERTSEAVFSETTGALHPSAEGHAAMADALLTAVRPMVAGMLAGEPPLLYAPQQ